MSHFLISFKFQFFSLFKDSNNLLVQELFQCKLTRKGTIAPSDRQSRLRKSMTNTFDSPSIENISIVNITSKDSTSISSSNSNQQQNNDAPFNLISEGGHIGGSNKVKFSIANNNNNNNSNSNASSITNGFGTLYPPNKNGKFIFKIFRDC